MTAPLSIIVPTRGGAARLPRLFASLARQTDQRFDVVVVVDGAIDDTEAYLAGDHPFAVTAVVFEANQGRSSALNAGFAAATGSILARCDDDLELPETYVADQIAWHTANRGGLIGLCRNVYPPSPYARVYGTAMDLQGRAAAYAAPAEETWRHWGANVSVPREVYAEIGPYDTDYRGYGWEDVDWGWRLHQAGYRIEIRPEIEAKHHVAATTTVIRAKRAMYSGAARTRFIAKHGDAMIPPLAEHPHGAWNRLVAATAQRLSEPRVETWGAWIDRSLPVLPTPVGRKAVALLVEAAHRCGYRRPQSVGRAI